jgi:hypothetical protein
MEKNGKRATNCAVLLVMVVAGCAEENVNWGNPTKVCEAPDGACWDWECKSDGCLPGFTDEIEDAWLPQCAENEGVYASWVGGRFFSIFIFCYESTDEDTGIYWSASPHQGRILVCESDDDCPQSKPSNRNECVNGLCQNKDTNLYPRDQITTSDAESLCFAGFNRAETVGMELAESVYDDIYAACPGDWNEPCTGELPDYCWSPDSN